MKNSAYFVEKISGIELRNFDLMVSFDIKSLFTRVPVDEAIDVLAASLGLNDDLEERTTMSKQTLCQLTEFYLRSTLSI